MITSIYAVDYNRYAIGLGDGALCVQWEYKKFYYFAHTEPVTSVKVIGPKVISCSADCCVRAMDFGEQNVRAMGFGQHKALVSSSWRLETLQYKKFNKASEFEASPPKLTLFQEYRGLQQELF